MMQASMFPLPAELVAHITSLRSRRLAAAPSHLALSGHGPPASFHAGGAGGGIRIGFMVHKLSGMLAGLLHDLLACGWRQPGMPHASPSAARLARLVPTFVLFAWDYSPSDEAAPAMRHEQLDGMDEILGLGGLGVSTREGKVCERRRERGGGERGGRELGEAEALLTVWRRGKRMREGQAGVA
jgi:hypothetical protein